MRLLIVEDDPDLNAQIGDYLADQGYSVDRAGDGDEAHFLGETEAYDAIVLDLGLPQCDGLTVLEAWRDEGIKTPVLILTARDRWRDKVSGIDAGADDYLTKPFHVEELAARLRALIRRSAGHASAELSCGPLIVDTRAARVSYAGQPVKLTALEYRLITYLAHHAGRVVSQSELTEHLYAQDFDRDSNTIEVTLARVRKKTAPGLIKTVRGLGYCLEPGEAEPRSAEHGSTTPKTTSNERGS
ncbi:MAG: response regulator transcription factor [Pseudomonadota bacterium]